MAREDEKWGLPYRIVKRAFDITVSLAGLVITSPILVLAAAAIVLDDPKAGPVYKQERVGKGQKRFVMYKLRTMRKGADQERGLFDQLNESDGPAFKIKDDPRITRVGKFLRRSNLDELPQLFNVLKGDMSLVGPRPPLPEEVSWYEDWQLDRLTVKPGITCIWQIVKNRNDVPFDDWVRMDLRYIENASPWEDIKLLWKTGWCVLSMNGR